MNYPTQHIFKYSKYFRMDFARIRKLLVHRENLGIWLDKLAYEDFYEKESKRPTDRGKRSDKRETIKCWGMPIYLSESLPENSFVIETINTKTE